MGAKLISYPRFDNSPRYFIGPWPWGGMEDIYVAAPIGLFVSDLKKRYPIKRNMNTWLRYYVFRGRVLWECANWIATPYDNGFRYKAGGNFVLDVTGVG